MGRKAQTPQRQRERIRVGQLIEMLHSVALTGRCPNGEEPSPARLAAARELLSKALPNLQAQEITTDTKVSYLVQVPAEVSDSAAWERIANSKKEDASEEAPKVEPGRNEPDSGRLH
jgi:hypothetical protein